jgi:hypothetical protein
VLQRVKPLSTERLRSLMLIPCFDASLLMVSMKHSLANDYQLQI